VDLRAGLGDLEKILDPTGTHSDPTIVQPVASCYTDYAKYQGNSVQQNAFFLKEYKSGSEKIMIHMDA
jgi:hypothetical protein